MTIRSSTTRFISMLAAVFLLSGCALLDQLKKNQASPPPPLTLQRPPGQPWESDKQTMLMSDVLYFAGQIYHMPENERIRNATALREMLKSSPFPKDRLVLALLALYVDEDVLPTGEALQSLDLLDPAEIGDDPELLGLINVLRQSLMLIEQQKKQGKELTQKLGQAKEKNDKLKADLATEKKKSEEMAQKLQKLLEIEEIMKQRKE